MQKSAKLRLLHGAVELNRSCAEVEMWRFGVVQFEDREMWQLFGEVESERLRTKWQDGAETWEFEGRAEMREFAGGAGFEDEAETWKIEDKTEISEFVIWELAMRLGERAEMEPVVKLAAGNEVEFEGGVEFLYKDKNGKIEIH